MADVAKPSGLPRRGNRFHYRVRVSADLRSILGKEHHAVGLGTSDPAEARRRCLRAAADFAEECEKARAERDRTAYRAPIWTLTQVEQRLREYVQSAVARHVRSRSVV